MDKIKALKETEELHEDSLAKIAEAERICEKIDSLLPKGWYSEFIAGIGQLEFGKIEKANAIEFRAVCGLVEKAIGCKLNRGIGECGNTYLYGWTWHWFNNNRKSLDIRVELNKPEGCKIEYKRTWEKKLVVDDACLGIRKGA